MKRKFIGAAAAVTAVVAMPMAGSASGNGGHDREPQLLGRAVLPAITIAPGPQSGAAATDANGVDFPIEEGQIVEGFSGVVEGDTPGQFLAMADNGFGAKTNSADFLLRAYVLEPEFRTAEGGSGDIVVRDWIQFRDPYEKIDFPIQNEDQIGRLLTGADLDPESIQRDRNGDLWVGDEFGPWILHFSADGVLLDAPFPIPGVLSPSNPAVTPTNPATIRGSRGFEAMAYNGRYLYAILEGAPTAADRNRTVYEFDTRKEELTGREWTYRTEAPTAPQAEHFIADAQAVGRNDLVAHRAGRHTGHRLRSTASSGSTPSICARSTAPTARWSSTELLEHGPASPTRTTWPCRCRGAPATSASATRSRWSASRSSRCARSVTGSCC